MLMEEVQQEVEEEKHRKRWLTVLPAVLVWDDLRSIYDLVVATAKVSKGQIKWRTYIGLLLGRKEL